jgi:hypothetical protein
MLEHLQSSAARTWAGVASIGTDVPPRPNLLLPRDLPGERRALLLRAIELLPATPD